MKTLWGISIGLTACLVAGCSNEADSFAFLEPENQGEALSYDLKMMSDSARVSVGTNWSRNDATDMQTLIDTSAGIIEQTRWLENGTVLKPDNPEIWLTKALGYADSEKVTQMVASPAQPLHYLPVTVVRHRGGAVTRLRNGNVQIALNKRILRRWRSNDPVERACAVNTMTHEISHTITRVPNRFYPAFTDTGDSNREARNGTVASYFTGDLALCTYLMNEGRIDASGLKKCVTAWYEPGGFQSYRCTKFNSGEPVQWPRAHP